MMKLLLLEDDQLFGESVEEFLDEAGFSVVWVKSGSEALEATYQESFDAMILDVNVPPPNGFEVLSQLRQGGHETPALFLTSRNSDADTLRGFDVGCDDFLKKPCSLQELLVRLKTRIRGSFGQLHSTVDLGHGLAFDIDEDCVTKEGKRVDINPKELTLLKLLIKNRGHVVSTMMIEQELYGNANEASYGAIRVYIANLKKIMGEEKIENIRGVGYRLEES